MIHASAKESRPKPKQSAKKKATPKSGPKAGPKKVNKKPAAVHEIATPAGEEPTDNDVEEQDALGEFETPPTKKQKVEKKPAAGLNQ